MSELPTPAPRSNRGSADSSHPTQGAARDMADIARLFLDGARNTPDGGAPRRLGPKVRATFNIEPPATQQREEPLAMPEPRNKAAASHHAADPAWELPKAILGMSGANDDASWNLLMASAAGLAREHATTVCILGMRENAFVLELVGHESPEDAPRLNPGAGMTDVQVARALFTIRDSVGMWLIAAPDVRSESFAAVVEGVPQWLIATSTNNDRVVAVYHQLKQAVAAAGPVAPPRAFIVGDDVPAALVVQSRLHKATKEFLKKDMFLGGVGPMCSRGGGATRIATIPIKPEDRKIVWTTVVDELCAPQPSYEMESAAKSEDASPKHEDIEAALDRVAAASAEVTETSATLHAASHAVFDQLSHVLDPEERAALSADLDDPITDEVSDGMSAEPTAVATPATFDIRDQIAPATSKAADAGISEQRHPDRPTSVPNSAAGPRGMTLRAFDFPAEEARDRAAQWQAVERSIRDLVADSILLDARPPMSWATDCCIAIDGNGGLHIWTLYKNGVSWYALREWAAEHRNLLALTRRDLVLNRELDVAVHIVLPLEDAATAGESHMLADVRAMMRTSGKSVFLYRLCAVRWNAREGIVVIPIG